MCQWDQRTYKLLHTVPALDNCQIKFNYKGDVIFGTYPWHLAAE